MYNYEIEPMFNFLANLSITSGRKSRMRTRFIKILDERIKLIEQERLMLLERYSKKDENGSPVIELINEIQQYTFEEEDIATVNREIVELVNEEFVIDQTDSNMDMLVTLQSLILDYEGELKGLEATQYDRYCEIVEELNY